MTDGFLYFIFLFILCIRYIGSCYIKYTKKRNLTHKVYFNNVRTTYVYIEERLPIHTKKEI